MSEREDGGWDLSEHGILWRVVVGGNPELAELAEVLTSNLQESVGPVDMLQVLLLDRIAAGYLRKEILLQANLERLPRTCPNLVGNSWYGNVVRHESLLDQAFHRDLILLMQLKKMSSAAPALSSKKPPQSDRSLLEPQQDEEGR